MAKIDKLTKLAEEHLDEGEQFHCVVMGAYETKIMGKDSVRNGIMGATDSRIVFYAKKTFGYELESFPLSNISSIEMGKSFMGGNITFFASGNKATLKWIKGKGDIEEFVTFVREKSGKADTVEGSDQPDIPDQIKKLSELRDQGILTEEEFEAKKTGLLAKM